MTAFALAYSLHVLAALIWVGGMFFAWMILRPAAITALEGPARLKLWVEVFQRFFVWVWVAVVILPISGVGLLQMRFNGFETAPRYVQIMMGLYIVMVALFIRIQSLQLPELRKAIEAQAWADGAAVMGRIRRLVGCNLIVGLVLVELQRHARLFELGSDSIDAAKPVEAGLPAMAATRCACQTGSLESRASPLPQ